MSMHTHQKVSVHFHIETIWLCCNTYIFTFLCYTRHCSNNSDDERMVATHSQDYQPKRNWCLSNLLNASRKFVTTWVDFFWWKFTWMEWWKGLIQENWRRCENVVEWRKQVSVEFHEVLIISSEGDNKKISRKSFRCIKLLLFKAICEQEHSDDIGEGGWVNM